MATISSSSPRTAVRRVTPSGGATSKRTRMPACRETARGSTSSRNGRPAARAYDWDFIKLNPRATYFAEAWGNVYEQPSDQRQPRLTTAAVSRASDLGKIEPASPTEGVFGEHLQALSSLVREVGRDVDIVHTI